MYSREHSESGHSEYQNAILDKFDAEGFKLAGMNAGFGVITVITDNEGTFACSMSDSTSGSNEEVCEKMNKYLGRAHRYFFGTEFDGPVE